MDRDRKHQDYVDSLKGDPRDLLALQRTRLAVERTFLAFVRTAIAILAGAVAIPLLFPGVPARVGGWALAGVAAAVVLWGLARYRTAKRRLELQGRKLAN
jgi:putative membrane protein